MTWGPPERYETADLPGGGTVDFGRGLDIGGQTVGTAPCMARFRGVADMPSDWFPVPKYSMHRLRAAFAEGRIPVEVERDCYRAAWLRAERDGAPY